MKARSLRRIVSLVGVIVMIGMIGCVVAFSKPATSLDLSDRYKRTEHEATCLKVYEEVNVRAEPIAISDKSDGETNSFGMVRESGFTLEITRFYTSDTELDRNGPYYGFLVEEIMNTPEGRAWFPNGIKKDPDGIVWINAKYIDVH